MATNDKVVDMSQPTSSWDTNTDGVEEKRTESGMSSCFMWGRGKRDKSGATKGDSNQKLEESKRRLKNSASRGGVIFWGDRITFLANLIGGWGRD